MKSVQKRIMITMCLLVVISLVTASGISIILSLRGVNETLEQTMVKMTQIASEQISNHLRVYTVMATNLAADERVADPNEPLEAKQDVLDEAIIANSDISRGNVLDPNGISVFTGESFADREYFKMAMQGKTWISDPLVSYTTGLMSIIIAAPIWEDGIYGTKVIGVLYLVPTETFLNDAIAEIKVSSGASAHMLNRDGTVIAHPDMNKVKSEANSQQDVKTDPSLADLAALEREMIAGNSGFGSYTNGGQKIFLAYSPIADTNGWSIAVDAPSADFMGHTYTSIATTIILLVVTVVIAIIASAKLSGGIGRPLSALAGIIASIADTGRVDIGAAASEQIREYSQKQDEIGILAQSSFNLIGMLESKVEALSAISDGDLTVEVKLESEEDAIGHALLKMVDSLNTMFASVHTASMQISAGSSQIAAGAQVLAQGATEQAATIEELSVSISEIAQQTRHNADLATEARLLGDGIRQNADQGSHQMETMVVAVNEISEASRAIGNVIKVIDEIAFQTNILALNAAVEAARAGHHGRGFAVVAEEVRNLAAKSAAAAKDTSALIESSIEKSQAGTKISADTAVSLNGIVQDMLKSIELISEISQRSDEQASAISVVSEGIDQVSQVVQQNSATSQQNAASSQEMNSQVDMLEQLMSQFKLKQGEDIAGHLAPRGRIPAPAHIAAPSSLSDYLY